MASLRVTFDVELPLARWGPLFQVFALERPEVALEWRPVGFPTAGRSLLDDADVGLFVHPRDEPGLRGLVLDAGPMVVIVAVGHRLAALGELSLADVLDEPFPGGPGLDPAWSAFWTLDEQRGAPARRTDDAVANAAAGLEVVAAGRAIATVPVWVANGLDHPGVVALELRDGPQVTTRMVWREGDENPAVGWLVDLARAWTGGGHGNGGRR